MKKIITILFILFAVQAFAGNLDNLAAIKSFTADFEQENTYEGVESFVSKGKVYVERGYKAVWDYEEPDEYYILEEGGVLYYSAELKQAIYYHIDPADANDPSALLLGILLDGSTITERFNATEKGNDIILVPKEYIGIDSVILTMDGNKPVSMTSSDNAGASIVIKFSKISVNKKLDRKVFERQLPAGTDYFEQ